MNMSKSQTPIASDSNRESFRLSPYKGKYSIEKSDKIDLNKLEQHLKDEESYIREIVNQRLTKIRSSEKL